MKNFGRALRLCLRHKFSVLASLICALAVSCLWAANIGAAYPVIKVVLERGSLHGWVNEWVDSQITDAEQAVAACESLELELDDAPRERKSEIRAKIERAEKRAKSKRAWVDSYRRIQPHVLRYLPKSAFVTLVLFVAVLIVGTLIKSLVLIAHQVLVARISQLGTFELRNIFFRRTLLMDVTTFSREGISDLMSRFTHDVSNVVAGTNVVFGKLIREPLKMIACLAGAAAICWRLLLLSLVIAPLAALMIRWLAKTLKRANRKAMEEMAQLYATLEEAFRGIKVVKSFTMERRERKRFHTNTKKYYKKTMKIARYDALSHPMVEMLGVISISVAMLCGAYLVLQEETHLFGIRMCMEPLTLEWLLTFYALLIGASDPARKLSDIFTNLQRAAAASDRVYAMLDREPEVRDPEQPRCLPRHNEDLVLEGVDFGYLPNRPVLKGIDLRIGFGETIGIVGPSGCGKSTLVNLIPRFADPTAGEIRLDGIPLPEARIRDLRGQIGLVTQEPHLFNDTVFNNIRYGSSNATFEQVVQAAKQAHAHRFIEQELAEGYQTVVGPMGGQISGGQRQRICLARAILRDPPILILDEATNQVDLESEQIIQHVLERFIRGRTVVLITHRLGALALADRIVVMQEGRILDVGTHEQLLGRCEFYRRLHQIQYDDLQQSA